MRAYGLAAFLVLACGRTDLDMGGDPADAASDEDGASPDAGTSCPWQLAPPVSYPGGVAPSAVAIGDLDGDGDADLAVNNYGAGVEGLYVKTLRNEGDGTFVSGTKIQSTVAFSMAVGPFVSSRADLLVGCDLFANRGDGTFAPAPAYGPRCGAQDSWKNLATADFDSDGRLDLAWALWNEVVVYLNEGAGTFREVDTQFSSFTPYVTTLASADFDRDGYADLATASWGYGNPNLISILHGTGDGTFDVVRLDLGDTFPEAIAAGDVDGDGAPDLVLSTAGPSGVQVRLQRADGTFGPPTVADGLWGERGVLLGDLDGDGALDIVVIDSNANTIRYALNEGGGTFTPPVSLENEPYLWNAALGDLNGDGRADLVAAIDLPSGDGDARLWLSQCQ